MAQIRGGILRPRLYKDLKASKGKQVLDELGRRCDLRDCAEITLMRGCNRERRHSRERARQILARPEALNTGAVPKRGGARLRKKTGSQAAAVPEPALRFGHQLPWRIRRCKRGD